MGANPYTNLGWNPVPGEPTAVQNLHEKVQTAATSLRSTSDIIKNLRSASSEWEGEAASAFRNALDDKLPKYIENAATSLEKASKALSGWDRTLSSHRELAKKYDEAAGDHKSEMEQAKARREEAAKHPDLKLAGQQFPTQEEADAATRRLRAAEQALSQATTELNKATEKYNQVIEKAKELEKQHEQDADKVAGQMEKADDNLAPEEPGWFSKAISAIGDALKEVGQFLLDHAGTIGAIAGLLALLPTPAAPVFAGIAVAASAVNMTKNLTNEDFRAALTGKYGWGEFLKAGVSVAGDTLGMLPGVGALARAGGEVGLAAGIARESGEALTLTQKLSTFADEVVPAFSNGALEVATNPATGKFAYTVNGVNVAGNMVSSLETLGVLPGSGPTHYGNEATKATATAINGWGTALSFADDVGELLAGIRL